MGHRLNCPCAIAQGVPTPMYPAAPIQPRGHATAPGSSPISVRLGIWSGWVGGKGRERLPKCLCARVSTG